MARAAEYGPRHEWCSADAVADPLVLGTRLRDTEPGLAAADLQVSGLRKPGIPHVTKGQRSSELYWRDAGHVVPMQQSYGK
ncbi:hypothetical protein GCM10023063_00750 [Arthrobacter methylotrophus]|uniref:hypothetical protein n=1 Tax=Arthrobacter methylotrophus TaxID=121291 RepID=UPI0031E53268